MLNSAKLPILQNCVESDHGCTFRILFDNAGDKLEGGDKMRGLLSILSFLQQV